MTSWATFTDWAPDGGILISTRFGETSQIHHDGAGVFADLEQDLTATRYHSLEVRQEDLPALVEESLEGTERVRKIVSDLRGFSRPADQSPRYANLNEALRSTLNIVHNEVKYKAQVVTEFGPIPEVRCQVGHINQVFMNMLVNAAHAIEKEGEIENDRRSEEQPAEGRQLNPQRDTRSWNGAERAGPSPQRVGQPTRNETDRHRERQRAGQLWTPSPGRTGSLWSRLG